MTPRNQTPKASAPAATSQRQSTSQATPKADSARTPQRKDKKKSEKAESDAQAAAASETDRAQTDRQKGKKLSEEEARAEYLAKLRAGRIKICEDSRFAKYFAMLAQGNPLAAVEKLYNEDDSTNRFPTSLLSKMPCA